jgi:hypothetical protein
MPDAVTLARLEADMVGKVLALVSDTKDALARGPRGARLVSFTGLHAVQRNPSIVRFLEHLMTPLICQTGPKTSANSGCSCSVREKRCISGRNLASGIVGIRS